MSERSLIKQAVPCVRAHRGFTLVELMVTLAVFAVLLGIAVPSFSAQIAQNRSQNAADGFKRVVSKARDLARDNGRRTTLTINGTPAVAGCDDAAWAISQGNEMVVTGTTATTSFSAAPQAGASRVLIANGAWPITHGANHFLSKPFRDSELLDVLHNVLQLKAPERRLTKERAEAMALQKKLLPASIPQIIGFQMAVTFRPAEGIAGDLYDFFPLDIQLQVWEQRRWELELGVIC
jgi:type IV fimbrial biogenesis protein FimT